MVARRERIVLGGAAGAFAKGRGAIARGGRAGTRQPSADQLGTARHSWGRRKSRVCVKLDRPPPFFKRRFAGIFDFLRLPPVEGGIGIEI